MGLRFAESSRIFFCASVIKVSIIRIPHAACRVKLFIRPALAVLLEGISVNLPLPEVLHGLRCHVMNCIPVVPQYFFRPLSSRSKVVVHDIWMHSRGFQDVFRRRGIS